jgi:hypothetical protein
VQVGCAPILTEKKINGSQIGCQDHDIREGPAHQIRRKGFSLTRIFLDSPLAVDGLLHSSNLVSNLQIIHTHAGKEQQTLVNAIESPDSTGYTAFEDQVIKIN